MSSSSTLQKFAVHFWCIGFFCITFDRLLTLEGLGYSIKVSYLFFLYSMIFTVWGKLQTSSSKDVLKEFYRIIMNSPWRYFVLLLLYGLLLVPFSLIPSKGILYISWGFFDVIFLAAHATILFCGKDKEDRRDLLDCYIVGSVLALGLIVTVDYAAYFFGYKGGLIGYNQGSYEYYASRPHAFSYEPSYLALYFYFSFMYLFLKTFVRAGFTWSSRYLEVLGIGMCIVVFMMTFSRSVMVTAFCGGLLALGFLFRRKLLTKRVIMGLCGGGALLSLSMAVFTPKKQIDRTYEYMVLTLFVQDDSSLASRLGGFKEGFYLAQDTHFLGTGVGSSYAASTKKISDQKLPRSDYGQQNIQSLWLEALAELGIIGLLIYGTFAFMLVRALYQAAQLTNSSIAWSGYLSLIVFFVFTAHWFPNLYRPDVWVWFAVFGIGLSDKESVV